MDDKDSVQHFADMRRAVRRVMREMGVAKSVSGARPTNRRGRAGIEAIKDAIYDALVEDAPMTVRQVFYRLVSTGVIDKSEGE